MIELWAIYKDGKLQGKVGPECDTEEKAWGYFDYGSADYRPYQLAIKRFKDAGYYCRKVEVTPIDA